MLLYAYLFGPPRFARNDVFVHVGRKRVVALAAFLLGTGQPHSRETLAAMFWPESSQREALKSLRRELARLKRDLGDDLITANRNRIGYSSRATAWIDVRQFEARVAAAVAHDHPPGQACSHCLDALNDAVQLYTGDFMAGFNLPDCPAFDDWQLFQREHLRFALADILHRLTTWHAAHGDYDQAIQYGRRWVTLDPLHEPAHRSLMQVYAWAGQPAAALRQYEACALMLSSELAIAPATETTQLQQAIRAGHLSVGRRAHLLPPVRQDGRTPRAQASPPHNLPLHPTPFVGRSHELRMILLRLQEPGCRLLTLVGPAGIGKTRLAVQAAHDLLEQDGGRFEDGIFLVALPDAASPERIAAEIAEATGIRAYAAGQPQLELIRQLREKKLLLILDNAEHLLPHTQFIAHILAAAPRVKFMMTSRLALNLHGEWFQPVKGMAVPGRAGLRDSALHAPSPALQCDAVQLFDLCARRARAGFSLQDEEVDVVRICRLVQGMPLAIELAAAWLTVLPAKSIADEIERGLDFLTSRHQDIPERHRSMRAVLDQTWALLDDEEQAVLQRLAAFKEGFTQEAAATVAGASLMVLAKLVEKALLHADETGRFEMHELLRQYAGETLRASGLSDATQEAHAVYFLNLLQALQVEWNSGRRAEVLRKIESEQENIRQAWREMLRRGNWGAIGRALDGLQRLQNARDSALDQAGTSGETGEQAFQAVLDEMVLDLQQEAAAMPACKGS